MREGRLVTAEEQATGVRKGQYGGGHAVQKMRGGPGHKSELVVYMPNGSIITIRSPRIQTAAQFKALSGVEYFAASEVFGLDKKADTVVEINFDLIPVKTFSETQQPYSEGS